jgi:hypothetical protein
MEFIVVTPTDSEVEMLLNSHGPLPHSPHYRTWNRTTSSTTPSGPYADSQRLTRECQLKCLAAELRLNSAEKSPA